MTAKALETTPPAAERIAGVRRALADLRDALADSASQAGRIDALDALLDDLAAENDRLRAELRRANELRAEFVSVMTHELRVPMTSIKGYADMLNMLGELNPQQADFLGVIRSNVERMSRLISDLSDISRLESGRLILEVEDDASVAEAVTGAVEALETHADERGHTLDVSLPDDLPAVRADPGRLQQALACVLKNAVMYTPEGGSIRVAAQPSDDGVRLAVTDDGIGMTEEERAKLFTKFWRGEDERVRDQPGTGLGLALAKGLVEMHGGALEVASEKNAGTTVTITVPTGGASDG
jgi:two-component system sensor histidine kinase VicK